MLIPTELLAATAISYSVKGLSKELLIEVELVEAFTMAFCSPMAALP